MVVVDYANKGNLRRNLTKVIEKDWNQRLFMLYKIISGLNEIHNINLIHCDFHDGNILNHEDEKDIGDKDKIYISDFGLQGNRYTPASDIYSFSMIMREFISGVPPFNDRAHDLQLSLSICKGETSEELKSNIMEFINAPIGNNNLVAESHPQACYTSRLLDFTSKELNKWLDCSVDGIKSLDIKTNKISSLYLLENYI
ncbi:hypothetical protein RclHR1_00770014 [Rhizophagus clarus]|uniref:Protein kinase domain-containing protein n=1 Tax=Rhizophagus clarus TaxID=94130 RepID=A0A2Z6RZT8_9GLOM|nr:hypothetical protein RclHR1_00770014 [Rhizophagus clarus]